PPLLLGYPVIRINSCLADSLRLILPFASRATPEADTEVVVLVTTGFVSLTTGFGFLTTIRPAAMASCTVWVLDLKSGVAAGTATAAVVAALDVLALDLVGTYVDDGFGRTCA